MRSSKILVLGLLATWCLVANAQGAPMTPDSVLNIMKASMAPAVNKLAAQAIIWLGAFSTLQFFMTNYAALKSGGDMQTVLAKAVFSVAWISVCIYIINNGPQFIGAVGEQMFGLLGLSLPSPGSIIKSTIGVAAGLAALAVGVGGVGIFGSTTAGMLLVYILLFVLAIGMFFAFKIFMVQLELGLIVMLSPMSFSLLGLNALKDQGIAPFKALLSLAYRIVLLTLILSAFGQVSSVTSDSLSGLSRDSLKGSLGDAVDILMSALASYLLLAYLVWKSDSVAASLASGSTSMGTGDLASAAAAGAAAGAAIMSGGAAAAAGMGKPPQLMSDFMRDLGQHGSVTNAMGSGGGGLDAPPPPPPPSMSTPGPSQPGSPGGGFDGTTGTLSPEQAKSVALPYKPPPQSKPSDGAAPQKQAESIGSGSAAGLQGPASNQDRTPKTTGSRANQAGFRDRLAHVNEQISREHAATHVSINPNQTD